MSNLVPVKRLNKNGVMVTKHVRAENKQGGSRTMPSPTLAAVKEPARVAKERSELAKRLKRLDKARIRTFSRKKMPIHANYPLEKFYKQSYRFSVSDNDFYTVLEKLSLSDTIVLMNAGLKAHQLDEFFEKNQYQYWEVDNSDLVAGLRSRGIPLESYLAVGTSNYLDWVPTAQQIDAAETHSMFPGEDRDWVRTNLTNYVGREIVDLADIKAVGLDRCLLAGADFLEILPSFKNGNSKCTAEELGEMLDRLEENREGVTDDIEARTLVAVSSRFAAQYGVDFMESISHPMSLYYSEEASKGMDHDAAKRFLSYSDQITLDGNMGVFDSDHKWEKLATEKKILWEAGVSVSAAREGLEQGMSADQIIGVHQHDIAPIVSSGWL